MPVNRAVRLLLLVFAILTLSTAQANNETRITPPQSGQDQQSAALDRINTYLSANPKDVKALFTRAVMLAEQNKTDEAIKAFTELTEKYPSLPEPYNNLAVIYAGQGQYDKARKALESAIKTHPSYATAHENLGDIYAKMASEAYDKALQLDNGNTRAQGKLALIKDIFPAAGKPVAVAAANTAKPAEPRRPAPAGNEETVKPGKPAEPVKPAEPPKASETAVSKPIEAGKPQATAPDNSEDIEEAVNEWAKAWSSKNVERYLGSYAGDFQPSGGESRKAWEKTRRERIDKPGNISVEVSDLQVIMEDSSQAKATFKQSYRAKNLSQRTLKTLSLKKIDGNWRIVQEITNH